MTYSEKLKDPRWQRKRLEVMKRDGFKCLDCGDDKSTLHVHHCFYGRGDPWETDDSCLMTLCDLCHEYRETVESKLRRILATHFALCDMAYLSSLADTNRLPETSLCPGNTYTGSFHTLADSVKQRIILA